MAAAERWQPGWLRGARDEWHDSINAAVCKTPGTGHRAGDVPASGCWCGFWAYWRPHPSPLSCFGAVPVFGVVETAGPETDVIIGDDGCRMSHARIAALHLPLTLQEKRSVARHRRRPFNGTVINIGTDRTPVPLRTQPEPEPEPVLTPAQAAELKTRAEAWMAIMGDRLEQMYPGTRIFEDRDTLLAFYPPDPVYGGGKDSLFSAFPG
jgi:hypothetical protein